MSRTEIYRLGARPAEIGSVRNSWRGAMYVWNQIAKDYFRLEHFPIFGGGDANKIWNASKTHPLTEDERVVLLSTMDNAVIRGHDRLAVAAAFDSYGARHPDSSYRDQAELLRSAEIADDDYVAWLQTSVSSFWGRIEADDEEPAWYDPRSGDEHFDAYAEAVAPTPSAVEPT